MIELGVIKITDRNFEIVAFEDKYGADCSLQMSSLAEYMEPGISAVWLGVDADRMHLDRDQVAALVATLQRWLDTGSFAVPERPAVVVDDDEWLASLLRALRNCESASTLVVHSPGTAWIGEALAEEIYPDKDIIFKVAPPTGECECGAERAAGNGRCGDGCDDD